VFGGIRLFRDEESLTGAATQRQRLALLALLAMARGEGLSRDKLFAFLWPEADVARARHALNQLVYAQRRQFAADRLFLGKKTLRLNPELVWSDVAAFEDALARGDRAAALTFYSGPFLDGFFLSGSPAFEEWAARQRSVYADRVKAALLGLAGEAARSGTPAAALVWWQRGAELDPLDTRFVAGSVEALIAAGDRAGAIRQARRHEELLRTELGVAPDPALFERIRLLTSEPG
jgi:DNA-binding SARP family transcriptional activator